MIMLAIKSFKYTKLNCMIENIQKLLGNAIRLGVVVAMGFSLYLIYSNYESFSLRKNVVEVQPQTTGRIIVTAAE
jgi:uncharacterized membrane protein